MDFTLSMVQMQAALAQAGGAGAAVPGAGGPAPVPQHLADSFDAMMRSGRLGPQAPSGDTSVTMVSDLVRSEDAALQYVSNDMMYLLRNADTMTINELTTASMQVQIEAASLQVDLQTKMSVVTSSKDAIETLMKNQ